MKEIRFNAGAIQSAKLRAIQAEYQKKFKPLKVSLETLANLAIDLGSDRVRMKLNLS